MTATTITVGATLQPDGVMGDRTLAPFTDRLVF